jgi:hypothetical protein
MYLGSTQQFGVAAQYSDGSVQDVTSAASWQSSKPGVASVSAAGIVQAVSTGSATITARIGAVSAKAALSVSSSSSGFTLVNDMTDNRLLCYCDSGSSLVFQGVRDDTGNPQSLNNFRVTNATNDWAEFLVDDQGRPYRILLSDGTEFGIAYESATSAVLTGIPANRQGAVTLMACVPKPST